MENVSWLSHAAASLSVLHELETAVDSLPPSYVELLARGNGGEVVLRVSPFRLCLDSAEDALAYWKTGLAEPLDVFVFGGDGGGTLLGFYIGKPGYAPVVEYDPIDPDGSMRLVAASFEEFLTYIESHEA
jgi:hypothetical protein